MNVRHNVGNLDVNLFRLKVSFLLISLAIVRITKLYDKRDDFNFPVVNFPFIWSNIPAARANGEYISKMILYSRDCGSYQDFLDRGLLLTR